MADPIEPNLATSAANASATAKRQTMHRRAAELLVLFFLLLLAAYPRARHLNWGLPDYYVPDELGLFIKGSRAWNCSFGNDHNRPCDTRSGPLGFGRFVYPHFHLYLITAVARLAGYPPGRPPLTHAADRIALGRWLTLLFSVATVLVTYGVARRLYCVQVAILSTALMAIMPYHIVYTHNVNVDIPMVFWMLVAFWLAVCGAESGRIGWFAGAGVSAGLATATKYPGAIVLLPVAVAALMSQLREPRPTLRRGASRFLTAVFTAGAVSVLTFCVACPECVLSMQTFFRELHAVRFYHQKVGVFFTLGRRTGWHRPYIYQLVAALPFVMGLAAYAAALAGLALSLRGRMRSGVLLWSFVLPYFLFVSNSQTVYPRYYLALLPFLAISAATAIYAVPWRRIRLLLLAVVVAYTACFSHSLVAGFTTADRVDALVWLQENTARGAVVGHQMMTSYDGFPGCPAHRSLCQGLRFRGLPLNKEGLDRVRPDYLVLSRPFLIYALFATQNPDLRAFIKRLTAGEFGYKVVHRTGNSYFQQNLYVILDPQFEAKYTHGRIGFDIFARSSHRRKR